MSDLLYYYVGISAVAIIYLLSAVSNNRSSKDKAETELALIKADERSEENGVEFYKKLYIDLKRERDLDRITKNKLQENLEAENVLRINYENKYNKSVSKQRSEQVRLGLVSENIMPFLKDFGHNPKETRGLFNPIDLIVFGEENITFVELKSGDSKLSVKQKRIKKQVENGNVKFEVHRVNENGYTKE